MSESTKISSSQPSTPQEMPSLDQELQVELPPDSKLSVILEPAPQDEGLLGNIISFARHPLSGLAQLFSPASPLSVNVSANPSYLSFGQVNVFGSATRSFSVTNSGDQDANLMFTTSVPYSVSSGRTIKPGQSAYFSVIFNPTKPGTFNTYVTGNYGISIALSGSADKL